jgi:chromosome segregation protein
MNLANLLKQKSGFLESEEKAKRYDDLLLIMDKLKEAYEGKNYELRSGITRLETELLDLDHKRESLDSDISEIKGKSKKHSEKITELEKVLTSKRQELTASIAQKEQVRNEILQADKPQENLDKKRDLELMESKINSLQTTLDATENDFALKMRDKKSLLDSMNRKAALLEKQLKLYKDLQSTDRSDN